MTAENCLTAFGVVIENPAYVVTHNGRSWGTNVPPSRADLRDAIPWQRSVTIRERSAWEKAHADDTVTVEQTETGKVVTVRYGDL